MAKIKENEIVTPECTIVWPTLDQPAQILGKGEFFYSATFLIGKGENLEHVKRAIMAAAQEKWPGKAKQMIGQAGFHIPINDGDEKAGGDPDSFYAGNFFLNGKSQYPVKIVDLYNEVLDADQIWGGCVVRAFLRFYGYDTLGKIGVGCGLGGIIKISDGDKRLGGGVDTGAVFADYIQEKSGIDFSNPGSPQFHGTADDDDIPF